MDKDETLLYWRVMADTIKRRMGESAIPRKFFNLDRKTITRLLSGRAIRHDSLTTVAECLGTTAAELEDTVVAEVKRQSKTRNESVSVLSQRGDALMELLASAKERIDIVSTSLGYIANTALRLLSEKLKADVTVRIVTLNPNHSFTIDRASDFVQSSNDTENVQKEASKFKAQMIEGMRECLRMRRRLEKSDPPAAQKFDLRVSDRFPTNMIFRGDDAILLGFILHRKKWEFALSRYNPHILLRGQHEIIEMIGESVDSLWSTGREISEAVIDEIEKSPIAKPL